MLMENFKSVIGYVPYVNTGTILDVATGKFQPGVNGRWVLNGGLGLITGVSGRAQTYKSGIAGSLMARALYHYKETEATVYETEFTIQDSSRYDDFVPEKVSDRIIFNNRATMNLGDFYDHLKEIGELKLKNKKDMTVDSPFIDPKTMKPYRIWIPTFAMCDSWSKAGSGKEDEMYNSKARMDDSSMNTLYMQEGGVKTRILRALPTLAAKYGIHVILTAHVGNKIDMDMYNKAPKQLQYMKGNDKMKNVGSEFEFLTTALIQTAGVAPLHASDKKSTMFPFIHSTLNEVNEVTGVMLRGKNNASGVAVPYVVSQYQGILNDVTNFYLCRKNGDFGLKASGRSDYTPVIGEHKSINRLNLRDRTSKEKELCRALEIMAHICYIQNYWSLFNVEEWVRTPIETVGEVLSNTTNPTVSDILNSTGVWGYGKQDKTYMSAFDVLELVSKIKKK